jgi:Tfp pilus assembly ATPase PilU
MVTNSRIADLIRENKPESITDAIEEGAFFDMQSFTQALLDLVVSDEVDQEVAANAATNRHDFLVAVERALKQKTARIRAEEQRAEEEKRAAAAESELPTLRVAQP